MITIIDGLKSVAGFIGECYAKKGIKEIPNALVFLWKKRTTIWHLQFNNTCPECGHLWVYHSLLKTPSGTLVVHCTECTNFLHKGFKGYYDK